MGIQLPIQYNHENISRFLFFASCLWPLVSHSMTIVVTMSIAVEDQDTAVDQDTTVEDQDTTVVDQDTTVEDQDTAVVVEMSIEFLVLLEQFWVLWLGDNFCNHLLYIHHKMHFNSCHCNKDKKIMISDHKSYVSIKFE